VVTICAITLAGLILASPLGKRVAALLALPAYYLIVEVLVPASLISSPYEFTSGWVGSLRITLSLLPLAVLVCLALRAAVRAVRHVPASGQPS
jgi:hypothetical protein